MYGLSIERINHLSSVLVDFESAFTQTPTTSKPLVVMIQTGTGTYHFVLLSGVALCHSVPLGQGGVRHRGQRRHGEGRHVLPGDGEEAPPRPGDRPAEPPALHISG